MTHILYGKERKDVNNEWGSEEGAGGNVVTAVQRELVVHNYSGSEDVVDAVLRKLYSNNKYKNYYRRRLKNKAQL